jgi:hypothetical protein
MKYTVRAYHFGLQVWAWLCTLQTNPHLLLDAEGLRSRYTSCMLARMKHCPHTNTNIRHLNTLL